ncbi:MAG: hypothetical protein ACREQ5_31795 [Candidatus Dormibacteria bacterium]
MYVAVSAGRCRPCHRRYVWPATAARLGEMRCPRCQRPLSRPGQPGIDTTIELSASAAREASVVISAAS